MNSLENKNAVVVIPRSLDTTIIHTNVCGLALYQRVILSLSQMNCTNITFIGENSTTLLSLKENVLNFRHRLIENINFKFMSLGEETTTHFHILLKLNTVWDYKKINSYDSRRKDNNKAVALVNKEDNSFFVVSRLRETLSMKHIRKLLSIESEHTKLATFFANELKFTIKDVEPYWLVSIEMKNLKGAQKLLFKSIIQENDGVISKHFNRYVSHFFARLLYNTSAHPNLISIFVFLIGIPAIYLTAQGDYVSVLIGTLLFNLNSIADGIDGELARVKFMFSHFGGWLDRIGDKTVVIGYCIALFVGYTKTHSDPDFFTLGLTALGGNLVGLPLVYFYGFLKREFPSIVPDTASNVRKKIEGLINAAVFGGLKNVDIDDKPPLKKFFIRISVILKNDFLATLCVLLAFFSYAHVLLYILLPMGIMMLIMATYGISMSLIYFVSRGEVVEIAAEKKTYEV